MIFKMFPSNMACPFIRHSSARIYQWHFLPSFLELPMSKNEKLRCLFGGIPLPEKYEV
jgi:hypothetical protein